MDKRIKVYKFSMIAVECRHSRKILSRAICLLDLMTTSERVRQNANYQIKQKCLSYAGSGEEW